VPLAGKALRLSVGATGGKVTVTLRVLHPIKPVVHNTTRKYALHA
jgi:hypothetical protein